jgi:hypothetical protein
VNVPPGLEQPDRRTCGAACMVLAACLADGTTPDPVRFGAATLATHRRLTSARLHGRLQLPWPRALGTPPWAVARELSAVTGRRHRTRVVRLRTVAPGAGALYVGNAWLPRHVLLVLEDGRCFDPATGRVLPLDSASLTRWRTRWFTVAPTAPDSTRRPTLLRPRRSGTRWARSAERWDGVRQRGRRWRPGP